MMMNSECVLVENDCIGQQLWWCLFIHFFLRNFFPKLGCVCQDAASYKLKNMVITCNRNL